MNIKIQSSVTTTEALKMAIEALAEFEWIKDSKYKKAIQACKEALAKPAQEPVEKYMQPIKPLVTAPSITISNTTSLSPPSWQGLSDDEIDKIWFNHPKQSIGGVDWLVRFARAIEQALKEKNSV